MTKPKVSEKEMLEHIAFITDEDWQTCPKCQAIRAVIEKGQPEVDEDWILTKANALLYAFRRRFKKQPAPEDVISMRDCLTDILMAAGVGVKKIGNN